MEGGDTIRSLYLVTPEEALDLPVPVAGPSGSSGPPAPQPTFYLYDHLGNTRVTFHADVCDPSDVDYHLDYVGDYFPYGKVLREYYPTWKERYLTTQHERDAETGLDYRGARFYDGELGRFLSVDPLAADYAGWSGYNYVLGNPVMFIDPDGRKVEDWYEDKDKTIQYDPNVTSQSDLTEGQSYLGKSHVGKGASGKSIYYSEGGSIFFKSEKDAYNRIWSNTQKTGKEHLGVVFKDGVTVLPTWMNDANTSQIEEYGFGFENKNGKFFLKSENYTHKSEVLGTVHSHNADLSGSQGVSGSDIVAFGQRTPGKPAFVFENNPNGKGGFIDGIMAYARNDWAKIDRSSLPSLNSVLSGRVNLSTIMKNLK